MGGCEGGDEMSVRLESFLKKLEEWAPIRFAEDWDNPGLQVGDRKREINKVMVALTPGEEAVQAAVDQGAELLLTHHPLIFKPVKNINTDSATGRSLLKLAENQISLYCMHTNLDIAAGGVNDVLAEILGLSEIELLADIEEDLCYKVVVYVPVGYEDIVRNAMSEAGAGCIGNYSKCTFQTRGKGTFFPQKNTNPFIGTIGKLEYADEYRLETIVPERFLQKVLAAMLEVHPYEEVAYDVFRLENGERKHGIGRVGTLNEEMTLKDFLAYTGERLHTEHLVYQGDLNKKVKKVALCGGSGISFLQAAKRSGADVYVTGDMKYHDAQAAHELGMCVIDAGHYGTEHPVTKALANFVQQQGLDAEIFEEQDYLCHWGK